jgi:hypothetical protein
LSLRERLERIRLIRVSKGGPPVERTVARELRELVHPSARLEVRPPQALSSGGVAFHALVHRPALAPLLVRLGLRPPRGREWAAFVLDGRGDFWLIASRPSGLFAGWSVLREDLLDRPDRPFRWLRPLTFDSQKDTFDLFLTQYARLIRGLDRERQIREMARIGFTHVEVNALAADSPIEERTRVRGEFYPDFYTYCPALDQFVSSRLNRGVYPAPYLRANLARLKDNARLALAYGLSPGLLCFEPRTLPEAFFKRFPTLRGARVDHPFRSFRPRFTLSLVHPAARAHYAELLTRLLKEVPELEFLSIWSNDSGSGFEHTKSLYVGRNGGPYLIREWKTDEDIARAAADNVARFLELMRDTGRRLNPRFRVMTRLESFYGERRHLWPRLRDGLDVEVNSLLARGWDNNYRHPRYAGVRVLGSALHHTLSEDEGRPLREIEARGSRAHFYHFLGPFSNHEPLLGVPFPWLVREKLEAFRRLKVRALAHHGGLAPADRVPYPVNQEVFRAFQLGPEEDADAAILGIARKWTGPGHAPDLVRAWRLIDRAVRSFPPMSIYSNYGVVWQRLFVRPLVPDIESIPEAERAYYERWMCSSFHNPNKVDLARDVLFELLPTDEAGRAFRLVDRNVWKPLSAAIGLLARKADSCRRAGERTAAAVFEDQWVRARALRCLDTTLRNTAAWVFAVHTHLRSSKPKERATCRSILRDVADSEIRNSRELLDLWRRAPVEWMIVSGGRETPFIYGPNFPRLLERKIRLTRRYARREPRVDPGYMFRFPGDPYASPGRPRPEEDSHD